MTPAAELMLERAREVSASGGDAVPSPCISICRMDPVSGLCEGCLRTLDEIAAWGLMAPDEKRTVWTDIEKRANA